MIMTNEKAIEILEIIDLRYMTLYPEERQAIRVAIEALKQAPAVFNQTAETIIHIDHVDHLD